LPDLICMGEVIVELNVLTRGPLRHVALFEKHAAGAEGNVAIGVSRLGLSSGIITRIGDDEFGQFILGNLRAENVDTTHVVKDRKAPTATFFVQRGYPIPQKSEDYYYRHNSAGSKLSRSDVDTRYLGSAKLFHVTGITTALSKSAREATTFEVKSARKHKVKVSLDTNIRLKLWIEQAARTALRPLCRLADIVFTSASDAMIILGKVDPVEIAKHLHRAGVETVVVKLGEKGAFASSGEKTVSQPMIPTPVEDPTGAGDSFAATFWQLSLRVGG
jgi:sugar/nucleoside kinase (ribokinase family)